MRRVICRDYIDNHVFIDELSNEARLLWFWYSISADDDGFIGSPFSQLRYIGVPENALQELIDTRYVLLFKTGVLVMKHWKMHNTLKSDRYKPTTYQDEFKHLKICENKAYTETDNSAFVYDLETFWNTNGNKMEPNCVRKLNQVKLSQIKLNNNVQTPDGVVNDTEVKKPDFAGEFAELWSKYPKKRGKDDAFRHYKVQRQKHTFEEIDKKLDEYIKFSKGKDMQYVLNGSTWFNGRWKDEYQVKNTEVSYDIEKEKARAERPIVYTPKNKNK